MLFSTFTAATLLAATVSAYSVLTPTLNSTVTKGETVSIDWSSVDTDADIFSVYITNFVFWPPVVVSLAYNVPRGDGSIDLRIPGDLDAGYGWQINFINGTNTYVIYAQSKKFFVAGPNVPDPVTTAPYPTYTGYSNTTAHATGDVTKYTYQTTSICKAVSTVTYATPVVWFVEPSKEAVCEMGPQQTVTVTVTPGYGGGAVSTGPGYEAPTAAPTGPGYEAPTSGYVAPTGTGAYVKPTGPAEFTGAATSVRVGGLAALMIGAVAFLL